MVRVYKPVNEGYDGWVVVYPELVDKLMSFLWNHGLCHEVITRSIDRHIHRAEKTGEFLYCEVLSRDDDWK
jgi:hypothetical protein